MHGTKASSGHPPPFLQPERSLRAHQGLWLGQGRWGFRPAHQGRSLDDAGQPTLSHKKHVGKMEGGCSKSPLHSSGEGWEETVVTARPPVLLPHPQARARRESRGLSKPSFQPEIISGSIGRERVKGGSPAARIWQWSFPGQVSHSPHHQTPKPSSRLWTQLWCGSAHRPPNWRQSSLGSVPAQKATMRIPKCLKRSRVPC